MVFEDPTTTETPKTLDPSETNTAGDGEAATTAEDVTAADLDDADDDDDAAPPVRKDIPLIGIDPETMARGIDTFEDLQLHERIREAIAKIGWTAPTPVQKLCLPYTLRGRDVAGFAQTGTGKTGVFVITIANRLLEATVPGVDHTAPRAVVIAPTRELAMQIEDDAKAILEDVGLRSLAVFGGVDYDGQSRVIKEGVDVIVATPGRLMDYVKKGVVNLKNIGVFVCDEADRMFDMGFIEDVEFFLKRIPENSQKLLFSATTNEQVKELAFEYLETPEYISVTPETITPEKIDQHAIHCHATTKLKVLMGLLKDHNPSCSIIFTNTKLTAEWLHFKLSHNGLDADLITGDLPQKKRIKLIQTIKEGKLKALIATDVASRGLHIAGVTHVYNFDLPDDASNYVHRVGRTARAGARGSAYSLVCDDYGQNLAAINDLLGDTIAMKSEWYDERYMEIEDKAGNPFEDRYKKREYGSRDGAEAADDRGDRGPRGNDRGDRGPRHGGGRDGGRDRDRDRDRGPRDGGRGPRQDRPQDRPDRGPRDQQARSQHEGQQGGQEGDAKRKRRRRGGRGGKDGQQQQGQQGQQHQSQHGRQGGRNSGHGKQLTRANQPQQGFFGMIKRFFKLIFGRK